MSWNDETGIGYPRSKWSSPPFSLFHSCFLFLSLSLSVCLAEGLQHAATAQLPPTLMSAWFIQQTHTHTHCVWVFLHHECVIVIYCLLLLVCVSQCVSVLRFLPFLHLFIYLFFLFFSTHQSFLLLFPFLFPCTAQNKFSIHNLFSSSMSSCVLQ